MKELVGLVVLILTPALEASAQEVYGWSSLEWNSSSQTLSGYAETELDAYATYYYAPKIVTQLFNQSGAMVATRSNQGEVGDTSVSASISVQGTLNQTYTLNSTHYGFIGYINDPAGGQNYSTYEDYYYYSYFISSPDSSTDNYGDFYWFGPGPDTAARTQVARLGSTSSSASTTTQGACGDERDSIISEYVSYQVGFLPACTSFTQAASSEYFSFSQYNYPSPATAPAKYKHAILTTQLVNFSVLWDTYMSFSITSGYRCPSQNFAAGGTHNSNHQLGIALDAGNPSHNASTYASLKAAALKAGADWTEPTSGPCGYGCVHADLRNHAKTYEYP